MPLDDLIRLLQALQEGIVILYNNTEILETKGINTLSFTTANGNLFEIDIGEKGNDRFLKIMETAQI